MKGTPWAQRGGESGWEKGRGALRRELGEGGGFCEGQRGGAAALLSLDAL